MLPTLAAGSSKRSKKNRAAAARVKAAMEGDAEALAVLQPPVDPSRFKLIPTAQVEQRKRKAGELKLPNAVKDGTLVHLPHGNKYTQHKPLPPSSVKGKSALEAFLTSKDVKAGEANIFVAGIDMLFGDDGDDEAHFDVVAPAAQLASRHRRRRLKQHQNWTDLLSTDLLEIYLLRKHSPTHEDSSGSRLPVCACTPRLLTVMLADWDCTWPTCRLGEQG